MCTSVRFDDSLGNMYFGRNLDWCNGYGEQLLVTPRNHIDNTGHQAVIGVGIVVGGYPMYFDCANESGVAIAGLNFVGYAHFPDEPFPGTEGVAPYTFPYWVASNFRSLAEVKEALAHTTLVNKAYSEQMPVASLHYMIGDATGSIVVEAREDGLRVYDDAVDVMTNQPPFDWHMENLRNYLNCSDEQVTTVNWGDYEMSSYGVGAGMRGIPGDMYSTSRFVRAAYINKHYPVKDSEQENVARLFHTLGGVAMIEGCGIMGTGKHEYTVYTSGYSQREQRYYYNTYLDNTLRTASLNDYADLDGEAVIFCEKE